MFLVKKHMKMCPFAVASRANLNNSSDAMPVMHPSPPMVDMTTAEEPSYPEEGTSDAARAPCQDPPEIIAEMATVMLSCVEKGCRKEIESLIKIVHKADFDKDVFTAWINNIDDCDRFDCNRYDGLLHHEGFIRTPVRLEGPGQTEVPSLYSKNIVQVLQKQVALTRKDDAIFQIPDVPSATPGHPMETGHFKDVIEGIRSDVMKSKGQNGAWWNDSDKNFPRSFVGLVQLYSDKTATTLKANALVAYPIHAVLLNFSLTHRRFLIDNGYTIVGFLPVGAGGYLDDEKDSTENISDSTLGIEAHIPIPLKDYIRTASHKRGREEKMGNLHGAILQVLQPLAACSQTGFLARCREDEEWNCFPTIASYCSDIPEGKDVSGILHGTLVKKPCIRCTASMDDIQALSRRPLRTMADTITARRAVTTTMALNVPENVEDILKAISLAPWGTVFEHLCNVLHFLPSDVYSMFTFETLHNLHLGWSKLLKFCYICYLSSEQVMTHRPGKPDKPASSMKNSVLRAVNSMLTEIQTKYPMPGRNVDFAKKEASSGLNGLFTNDGLKGMLEGKDYQAVDYIFPFVAAFTDRCLGRVDSHEQTTVHTKYTELMNLVTGNGTGVSKPDITELVSTLKRTVVETFKDHCEKGLFTLKFHTMDHLAEDISRFGSCKFLDAGAFEHFNLAIKRSYRTGSLRHATRMSETVNNMGRVMKRGRITSEERRSSPYNLPQPRSVRVGEGGNHLAGRGYRSIGTEGTLEDIIHLGQQCGVGQDHLDAFSKHLLRMMNMGTVKVLGKVLRDQMDIMSPDCPNERTTITLHKSGFVVGGFVPDLKHYDRENNIIRSSEDWGGEKVVQRIFADDKFGHMRKAKNSFVLVRGGTEQEPQTWIGKVVLLLRSKSSFNGKVGEFAFIQYFDCCPPADAIDKELGCVCLRWARTDDEHGASSNMISPGNVVIAGEWFGLAPIESVEGTVHIVRANMAIHPHTPELPWTSHRFYINRFYREVNTTTWVPKQDGA